MPHASDNAPSPAATDKPLLRLAALRAPGGAPASLDVMPGEAVSLLGPEAGVVVAMVAGLLHPQSGVVTLAGRARPHPGRAMGVLIGLPALLPQRDLARNVALGGADAAALLAALDLAPVARFRPDAVSPAQTLRAALARALAARPGLLLLDPDLTALDGAARRDFFARLAALRAQRRFAVLHATVEAEEAWALADRVAVLGPTGIHASAPARDLYVRPPDAVTARALGPANLLPGTVRETDGEEAEVVLAAGAVTTMANPAIAAGSACLVLVRPEDVAVLPGAPPEGTEALAARVAAVRFHAGWNELTLVLAGDTPGGPMTGGTMLARRPAAAPLPAIGESCAVAWPVARALVLPPE
jgi:ABC-type sulfate/molybdate transport systems ATPase subunit